MDEKPTLLPMRWASKNVGKVLARAQSGETLVITRYGKPVAIVKPDDERAAQAQPQHLMGRTPV